MKTIQKSYRFEEESFYQAEDILNTIGLTVSQAFTLFLNRINMEKELPFTPGIVKSAYRIELERKIEELSRRTPTVNVNFETGENVDEFFAE